MNCHLSDDFIVITHYKTFSILLALNLLLRYLKYKKIKYVVPKTGLLNYGHESRAHSVFSQKPLSHVSKNK
jgi:hypothetical protein